MRANNLDMNQMERLKKEQIAKSSNEQKKKLFYDVSKLILASVISFLIIKHFAK